MKKLQEIVKEHKVLTLITGFIAITFIAPLITNTIVFVGIVLGLIWVYAICTK